MASTSSCGLLLLLICLNGVGWVSAGPYPSLGAAGLHQGIHPGARGLEEPSPHVHHRRNRRASPTAGERPTCNGQEPAPGNRVDSTSQLSQLRQKMTNQIQAYIIPMDDAHQSEYVSSHDKRIQFISGFSGSAGTAVVLASDKAALWVDGRYFLQGEQELDCQWTLMKMGVAGVPSLTGWLAEVLTDGNKVGADPKMVPYDSWQSYKGALSAANLTLVEVEDLAGQVWDEAGSRPPAANDPLLILGMEYAGETWQDKVKRVRAGFGTNAQAAAITALDDVAWLFNLRGSDIEYNPVFFAYTIVKDDSVTLYLLGIDRLTQEIRTHLNTGTDGTCADPSSCVQVKDYAQFYPDMEALKTTSGVTKVWVSPMASYGLFSSLGQTETEAKERAYLMPSRVRSLKGRKNPVEVEGLRRCHIRDSAALVEFVSRLEKDVKEGLREWDEISASDALDATRRKQDLNKGLSFHTISASGSNGAVIHYTASNVTKKAITTSDMYLLDSGGQYLDGTTDVTRTFHFGQPTDFQKEAYTRVLMGVIDLATAIWPQGTYGRDLDVLARRPLWSVGLDYRHGTGHGIGFFLNVHEGPGRINIGYRANRYESPLDGEMFFSDEPGYYQDGEFGIRLETIVMTTPKKLAHRFGDIDYLGFEAFTLVPFEPVLIKLDMLNPDQRRWLNEYHKKVQDEVAEKFLKPNGLTLAYDWVTARTAAVPETPTYNTSHAPRPRPFIALCLGSLLLAVARI